MGGDLRVGSWAGISVEFAETGQEGDGRLWQEEKWTIGRSRTVCDVGVFPAPTDGGTLLSAPGLSLFMR